MILVAYAAMTASLDAMAYETLIQMISELLQPMHSWRNSQCASVSKNDKLRAAPAYLGGQFLHYLQLGRNDIPAVAQGSGSGPCRYRCNDGARAEKADQHAVEPSRRTLALCTPQSNRTRISRGGIGRSSDHQHAMLYPGGAVDRVESGASC